MSYIVKEICSVHDLNKTEVKVNVTVSPKLYINLTKLRPQTKLEISTPNYMDNGKMLRVQLGLFFQGKRCILLLGIKNHEIAFGYYKGNTLKNIYAGVMVRVYDTSSECALQLYESKIRCKDLKLIQSNTTPDPGFVEISLTVIK